MTTSNPLLWGASGALLVVALIGCAGSFGYHPHSSQMSVGAQIAGGFFWGWVAGNVKNWLGRRMFDKFTERERRRGL